MGISVKQALELDCLKEGKVLSGDRGLSNIITCVNIMEVPDVVKWLRGGELLLTSGFAFRGDVGLEDSLVYKLAQKGVAALAVKPGQYLDSVPESLIAQADEIGLPLIEIPRTLPYMDIMIPIHERIYDEQLARLRRATRVYELLSKVVLEGGSLNDLCSSLSRLIENPVIMYDLVLDEIAFSETENGLETLFRDKAVDEKNAVKTGIMALQRALQQNSWDSCPDRFDIDLEVPYDPPKHLRLAGTRMAVRIRSDVCGYLVVLEANRPLTGEDLIAVESAHKVITQELSKRKAVRDAELGLKGELFNDLIRGGFASEKEIQKRAHALNLNLDFSEPLVVVVASIDCCEGHLPREKEQYDLHIESVKKRILGIVEDSIQGKAGDVLIQSIGNTIVCLLQPNQEYGSFVKRMAQAIQRVVSGKSPQIDVSVGISLPSSGLCMLGEAYQQALLCIKLGKSIHEGSGRVVAFDSLGSYQLLWLLRNFPEAKEFVEQIVGELFSYDAEHDSDLCRTLASYFRHAGNLRKTAEDLYIHKNTVIYRLNRIEDLTGLRLSDPEDSLSLQIALKTKRLFD